MAKIRKKEALLWELARVNDMTPEEYIKMKQEGK